MGTHTLEDRARWLYLKADRFLRARHPDVVAELTAGIVDEDEQPDVFDALLESTLVADIVLHEDGVFAEFLAPTTGSCPLTRPCSAPSGPWPTAACSRSSRSSGTPSNCAT